MRKYNLVEIGCLLMRNKRLI